MGAHLSNTKTGIEWTDRTWNPTSGCTKVSGGCKNCYAKAMHDQRHKAHAGGKRVPSQYAKPFEVVQLMPHRLRDPLSWRKPCRVFVNSVSDLFHEDIPDEYIDRVFAVMFLADRHTFQVLTKRAERMREWATRPTMPGRIGDAIAKHHGDALFWTYSGPALPELRWPLPNVWLGTSVENRAAADDRIPHLLATPAAARFVSCEPLLSGVDLEPWLGDALVVNPDGSRFRNGRGIDWVIVGGESGPSARPFDLAWARDLRDQCAAAGVAYFFKQMGENIASLNGLSRVRFRDKGGRLDDIPADLRVREFPQPAT